MKFTGHDLVEKTEIIRCALGFNKGSETVVYAEARIKVVYPYWPPVIKLFYWMCTKLDSKMKHLIQFSRCTWWQKIEEVGGQNFSLPLWHVSMQPPFWRKIPNSESQLDLVITRKQRYNITLFNNLFIIKFVFKIDGKIKIFFDDQEKFTWDMKVDYSELDSINILISPQNLFKNVSFTLNYEWWPTKI